MLIVSELIQKKADVYSLHSTTLDHLQTTFIPPPEKMMPIHIAAIEGYLEVVKVLVESKCDVNCKENFGRTPFLQAAKYAVSLCAMDCEFLQKNPTDMDILNFVNIWPVVAQTFTHRIRHGFFRSFCILDLSDVRFETFHSLFLKGGGNPNLRCGLLWGRSSVEMDCGSWWQCQ